MPVTSDIIATYRGPKRLFARLMAAEAREDRALVIIMAACAVMFVANWPAVARRSYETGEELNMLLGGGLLGWIFIAPLIFYTLALIVHWLAKPFGSRGAGYGSRIALFWSLLAASPIALFYGLVGGFIGAGPALNMVGLIWCAAFVWFWLSGFIVYFKGAA